MAGACNAPNSSPRDRALAAATPGLKILLSFAGGSLHVLGGDAVHLMAWASRMSRHAHSLPVAPKHPQGSARCRRRNIFVIWLGEFVSYRRFPSGIHGSWSPWLTQSRIRASRRPGFPNHRGIQPQKIFRRPKHALFQNLKAGTRSSTSIAH